MTACYPTELLESHVKTFSMDSKGHKKTFKFFLTGVNKQSELQFHCKPVPGKLLSKARKSVL